MPPTDIPDTWDDCNVCRGRFTEQNRRAPACGACQARTIAALRARVAELDDAHEIVASALENAERSAAQKDSK